jgi:hypothetical protein
MVVLDSKECEQCNEVADKAFSDNKLGESLGEKYISIRLKPGQEEWTRMTQQYDAPSGTATLFLQVMVFCWVATMELQVWRRNMPMRSAAGN